MKKLLLAMAGLFGIDAKKLRADTALRIRLLTLEMAIKEQGLSGLVDSMRKIIPDISGQYTKNVITDGYWEVCIRGMHAWQIRLVGKALDYVGKGNLTIADIGDSSGNHLLMIKKYFSDREINPIGINIDPVAVEKIRGKGFTALQCRAENLDLGDLPVNLFLSFEMLEHLMDPCLFLRRLALKGKSDYFLVTVPYVSQSRVALHTYSAARRYLESVWDPSLSLGLMPKSNSAEGEHIFEFSPIDWKTLMLFSGWEPIYDEIYLQYPRHGIGRFAKGMWKNNDFEGFYGVLLKRNLSFSKIYTDWPD